MLHIDLLGTGGMMPLPERYLTSLMVRYNGKGILVDCGEGTQVAIRAKGLGFKHISVICITHFHADHIAGLPGLLLTMGNSNRKESITIIGPKGLEKIVKGLLLIAPYLPFKIEYIETEGDNDIFVDGDLRVSATQVEHDVFCLGYKIEYDRKGKFDSQKVKESNLPVKYWSRLQNGENIEFQDKIYKSLDFMGDNRRGIKVVYTTDLRPSDSMVDFAKDADLFICEGIYGEVDKLNKALEYKHTMFNEAAKMAKDAGVGEMWLTHFSPSLQKPLEYLHVAKDIFPHTFVDKLKTELTFKD